MLRIFLIFTLSFFTSFTPNYYINEAREATDKFDFSAIDKILNDSVPERFGGNCYALICVDGKVAYSKSFGGYNGDTRKLIASCSKWLSAAVVMSLVDDGTIKLTDTVGKYLPQFSQYGKGNITIAQLFSHTSGLRGNSLQRYERDQTITLAQAADLIGKNVPLISPPGTKFFYGGVSMQVGGRICEIASGKSWKELFKERIAKPCGMTNTDYGPFSNPIIGGGARSTPNDYMKFLIMIMNNGLAANGTTVLSSSAVNEMEKSQTGNVSIAYSPYPFYVLKTKDFYGIGNWRDVVAQNGGLIENSSPGAFGSHPWINRDKKITGFIFTYVPERNSEISSTAYTCFKIRSLCRNIVSL